MGLYTPDWMHDPNAYDGGYGPTDWEGSSKFSSLGVLNPYYLGDVSPEERKTYSSQYDSSSSTSSSGHSSGEPYDYRKTLSFALMVLLWKGVKACRNPFVGVPVAGVLAGTFALGFRPIKEIGFTAG